MTDNKKKILDEVIEVVEDYFDCYTPIGFRAKLEHILISADDTPVLGWLETEIVAGKVLVEKTTDEEVWNRAHDRVLRIIRKYKKGQGLFQLGLKEDKPDTPEIELHTGLCGGCDIGLEEDKK